MKRREGARPASAEPNDGCAVRPAGSAAPSEAAGGLGADEPGYAEGGAGPARPAAAESGGDGGVGGAGASAGHGTGAAGAAPASTARPPRACVSAGLPSEGGVLRDPVAASATPRADAACDALRATVTARGLVAPDAAALLMVSGGSDSTALAYLAHRLREEGSLGAVAMLHVNHQLRGADADADALFVAALAACLGIPLFSCEVDVAGEAARTGGNVEAVARRERYQAANEALRSLCRHEGLPLAEARILTAHTADDRIESFYMRSIVGTGPGGFRGMLYRNGRVVRPLLDCTREGLRAYLEGLAAGADGGAAAGDASAPGTGGLWREDATNAHTDRFRAYVRHEIVPKARAWNEGLDATLGRTMNLIADEDDMLEAMADDVVAADVAAPDGSRTGEGGRPLEGADFAEGFLLEPSFGCVLRPLQRRVVHRLLQEMLGAGQRVDAASVAAVLDGFADDGIPQGGYVANIQGNLAVSANKLGVRVEPMAAFRSRRNRA